jgi:hypothetical protein
MRPAVVLLLGSLTACSALPQFGPMPVNCDAGVPPNVCDGVREDWPRMTEGLGLTRDRIVRIDVECVACDPTRAQMEFWAVLTDGTTVEIGEADWVPDWADFPEAQPPPPVPQPSN